MPDHSGDATLEEILALAEHLAQELLADPAWSPADPHQVLLTTVTLAGWPIFAKKAVTTLAAVTPDDPDKRAQVDDLRSEIREYPVPLYAPSGQPPHRWPAPPRAYPDPRLTRIGLLLGAVGDLAAGARDAEPPSDVHERRIVAARTAAIFSRVADQIARGIDDVRAAYPTPAPRRDDPHYLENVLAYRNIGTDLRRWQAGLLELAHTARSLQGVPGARSSRGLAGRRAVTATADGTLGQACTTWCRDVHAALTVGSPNLVDVRIALTGAIALGQDTTVLAAALTRHGAIPADVGRAIVVDLREAIATLRQSQTAYPATARTLGPPHLTDSFDAVHAIHDHLADLAAMHPHAGAVLTRTAAQDPDSAREALRRTTSAMDKVAPTIVTAVSRMHRTEAVLVPARTVRQIDTPLTPAQFLHATRHNRWIPLGGRRSADIDATTATAVQQIAEAAQLARQAADRAAPPTSHVPAPGLPPLPTPTPDRAVHCSEPPPTHRQSPCGRQPAPSR